MSESPRPAPLGVFTRSIAITDQGLVLGAGSKLVRMVSGDKDRLALETDTGRLLAMLSAAFGQSAAATNVLHHVEAAANYWYRGNKALANFRLIFADLPILRDQRDADRLRLAEYVLDHGVSPDALMREIGLPTTSQSNFQKYREDEPRVPAGFGDQSGQWTSDPSFLIARPRPGPAVRVAEDLPEEDQKEFEARRLTGQTSRQEELEHGRGGPIKLPEGVGRGPYAQEGVPAGPGPRPSPAKQLEVDAQGKEFGCHMCGTKNPGTPSGRFYCDHQPPTALCLPGGPQRYFPHCLRCSSAQGGLIKNLLKGR